MTLPPYQVPDAIKYIAAFLTFKCQLNCPYCINKVGGLKPRKELSPQDWIRGLSRLHTRPTLPITLQGGEPTFYNGFYKIVEGFPTHVRLDLLTNAQFDIQRFISCVDRYKFGRLAPYAPIRISYHRATMHPLDTIDRAATLQKAGFNIGIWIVNIPQQRQHNEWFKALAEKVGIEVRWKEYLAPDHGTYHYPDAVFQKTTKTVSCQTSEILIDPAGQLFRCHADLYANRASIGSILNPVLPDFTATRPCSYFGQCSPCDVKQKTNYLQQPGHCAVTIKPK